MSGEILAPQTGELVDPAKLATTDIAGQLESLRAWEADVRSYRRALSDEVASRLDHEGRRSADVGEFVLSVNPPTEKQWRIRQLEETLADLVVEGAISREKAQRCIVLVPKVAWSEIKTLLSDPRISHRIEPCFDEVPIARYIKVKRVGD